jgi:ubiquinone biosynthesis protein
MKTSWADYWFDARRTAFTLKTLLRMAYAAWRDRAGGKHPGGWPISLRVLFEQLGLTYLKLGQFLALRLDLIPEAVRQDLNRLFENVEPVEYERIRSQIETELGAPVNELFSEFAQRPLAAASVAQVHTATTADGSRVVVKVQRPGVEHIFASDVRLMRRLARVADLLEVAGTISLTEAVDQFARWTSRELDFIEEGSTADRLRASAKNYEVIPVIHWALTTQRVLTMDYVEGLSIGEIASATERDDLEYIRARLPGVDLPRAFRRLAQACMHQIFVEGFFHGDPHPGNLLVMPDGGVAFVDFGIFGELTYHQRQLLRSYLADLILGRSEESFRSYVQFFTFAPDSDFRRFREDIIRVQREWYTLASDPKVPPEERTAGKFSDRISAVVRQHRVHMNMELLLFWRVFIVLDAVAARLSTGFDLLRELNQFFRRTDTDRQREASAWVSLLEETLDSSPGQVRAATKIVLRLTSGWPTQTLNEEAERKEQGRNGDAAVLAMLLAGISFAIVIISFVPRAAAAMIVTVLAALSWYTLSRRYSRM